MKILYKLASRSRPTQFINSIYSIISQAQHQDYLILASLDADDETMNTDLVRQQLSVYAQRVVPVWGISKNKVAAINRDIDLVPYWDILCNHSDDMFFRKKGFDLEIIAAMQKHFPDGDGMLHFPDGELITRDLITYAIMGRKYYDRFGYIYHPSYVSLCADNEQTAVAKQLGRYRFIDQEILEHRHPAWGKAPMDAQYRHTESFLNQDADTLRRRRQINWGL